MRLNREVGLGRKMDEKTPVFAYVSNLFAEISLNQSHNQLDIKLETNPRVASFELFLKNAFVAEIYW